ncbi:MAG: organomercurial lyase MerB [Acidimicrobiales bacterium]
MSAEPSGTCTDASFIARHDGHRLFPHLVRLLARGRPLPLEELAGAAKEPLARIRSFLEAQPATEWDDHGRLVGFGLTQRPTPHRLVVGDQDLCTWCATDTLLFTVILGRDTTVHSRCPATGQAVHVELSPQGLRRVDPHEAVVSQITPAGEADDFRSVVCDHGHFFASAEHARPWLGEHPGGLLLGVAAAFEAARATCVTLGWVAPSVTEL